MAEPAILDVDLLAYERGDGATRAAVVDGVPRSLATGFVYTGSDLPVDLLDTTYRLFEGCGASLPFDRGAAEPASAAAATSGTHAASGSCC
jgi:hypothetical protein